MILKLIATPEKKSVVAVTFVKNEGWAVKKKKK